MKPTIAFIKARKREAVDKATQKINLHLLLKLIRNLRTSREKAKLKISLLVRLSVESKLLLKRIMKRSRSMALLHLRSHRKLFLNGTCKTLAPCVLIMKCPKTRLLNTLASKVLWETLVFMMTSNHQRLLYFKCGLISKPNRKRMRLQPGVIFHLDIWEYIWLVSSTLINHGWSHQIKMMKKRSLELIHLILAKLKMGSMS